MINIKDNRKTVISRPSADNKKVSGVLDVKDNLNKSGNKDSIKLVATEDVQNILDKAKVETEAIRSKIATSITNVLHVPECLLATKAKFTTEVLSGLDVHQMLSLYNRILGFERRIRRNAK